jgi:exonuclease SbcC
MVKRVRLVNIRSHVDTTVEFSTGVNLIEGDVGSGKTTILQSIESALFGYEIKNMLRVGESSGEISVEFEPPLKVGWRITRQGVRGGYIVQDGSRSELAAGEIRSFFVKKFGLGDSPSLRSEPAIFRLAVYVRQEELKSILKGGAEVEELVRRATGVRVYSIARENAKSILRPWLANQVELVDQKIRLLEERVSQASGVEEELNKTEAELNQATNELEDTEKSYQRVSQEFNSTQEKASSLESQIARIEGELSETERNTKKIETQLARLSEQILADESRKLELEDQGQGSAGRGNINAEALDVRMNELLTQITRLTNKKTRFERDLQAIDEHRARIRELHGKIGSELDYNALSEELRLVESRQRELYGEQAKIDKTLSEYRQIAETGVCPVCGSRIAPDEYRQHLAELEDKLVGLREEVRSLEKRRSELSKLMEQAKVQSALKKEMEEHEREINRITAHLEYEEFDEEIDRAKRELEAARKLKDLLVVEERLDRERSQYQELSEELERLTGKAQSLRLRNHELRSELDKLKPVLELKRQHVETLERRMRELISLKSSLESRRESLTKLLAQKERDQAELEESKSKRATLANIQNYVVNALISTLEQIEVEKLRSARRELLARTKEYFALLMQDDDRGITIDEDYSPTLQRRINGEWVDIPSPSGGERSAMALSFRLALSEVARSKQGVQADFIMLDEPTDGFSEDQLTKFQTLIERLEISQVILVTHHRAFESLGSNIISVEYTQNGSVARRVI